MATSPTFEQIFSQPRPAERDLREPEPEELEGFSLVYEQCDCDPEILVRAVTTHQEYQYY